MSSLVPMIPMMPKTQVMPRMMKILKVRSLIYSVLMVVKDNIRISGYLMLIIVNFLDIGNVFDI